MIGRFGGVSYVDNALLRRLYTGVPRHRPGAITWSVQVSDAEFERPDDVAFGTRYHVDDALVGGEVKRSDSRNWTDYPWPTTGTEIDADFIADIRRFAPTMLWFLADRHDLGLMLLRG